MDTTRKRVCDGVLFKKWAREEKKQEKNDIWRSKYIFEVTEQRLMDQIRQIKKNKWLSNLEIENIKRRIEEEVVGQGWNACKRGG